MLDGGEGGKTTVEAGTMDEARELGREWAREGEWGDEACYCDVSITEDGEDDTEEDGEEWSGRYEVGSDPEPPDCDTADGTHQWRSPIWLGGCDENPGVWSTGGNEIATTEVCRVCGIYSHYTSADQNGHDPAHTTYEDADERSLAFVASQ